MSRFFLRRTPGVEENLAAGIVAAGLAAGVAALSFYLVRLYLAREPMEPLPTRVAGPDTSTGTEEEPA